MLKTGSLIAPGVRLPVAAGAGVGAAAGCGRGAGNFRALGDGNVLEILYFVRHGLVDRDRDQALVLVDPGRCGFAVLVDGIQHGVLGFLHGGECGLALLVAHVLVVGIIPGHARGIEADQRENAEGQEDADKPAVLQAVISDLGLGGHISS